MKYVKGLSEAEQRTLLEASRYAPWPRFRQRAHAVLLSGKRYSLTQLADIFEVDRDTVSGWLKAWEQHGLLAFATRSIRGGPARGQRKTGNGCARRSKRRLTSFVSCAHGSRNERRAPCRAARCDAG